jgi:exopolysaccharide production protein ExoZ
VDNLSDHGVAAFFYTRPILLDFILGMLLGRCLAASAPTSSPVPWLASIVTGTAWLAFGGEIFTFGRFPVDPPSDTFLRFGLPSGLIVAGAVGLERSGIKIGTALMEHLGDASYSVYLSHYFFVAGIIVASDTFALTGFVRALLAPLTLVASIAGGIASYHLVERPLAGNCGGCHRLAASFLAVIQRLKSAPQTR